MIEDFKPYIGKAWLLKQATMETDTKRVWSYHLPEVAATEKDILETEKQLGHTIDPRYRAFLLCANGWKAFYHAVDLFGTNDLINGERHETGEYVFSCLEDGVLKSSKLTRSDLLPIAVAKHDRDLFVLGRPQSSVAGKVFWFAGEEIECFSSFDEYFLSMIEYNKRTLDRLIKSGTGNGPQS